jgi:ADP-ribose pyrophosphatase YjhB (NUDIX family)
MKYIKTIRDEDVFENPKFMEPEIFKKRITVKAVVINDEGKFGFVTSPRHGFYLLAGGGAESDNLEKEIKRECGEEMNFEVNVLGEVGRVYEYRNRDAREGETICFAVKTIKELSEDTRTEDEKENDLQVVWFNKDESIKILHQQVEKIKNEKIKFYNTSFNIVRDDLLFSEYIIQSL